MSKHEHIANTGSHGSLSEAEFVSAMKDQLDLSCSALDGYTLSQLHRIRSSAVVRRPTFWAKWWLPVAGFATACALVLVVNTMWHGRVKNEVPLTAVENMELLVGAEDIDFYADYEFYEWLAMN